MKTLMDKIGGDIIWIVAIICFTVYHIMKLRTKPNKYERYEELKTLNELREKGVITQEEFDEKKTELLDE